MTNLGIASLGQDFCGRPFPADTEVAQAITVIGAAQDVLGFVHDQGGLELGDEFIDAGGIGEEADVVAGGG